MIQNFEDFCWELNNSGFSMDSGNFYNGWMKNRKSAMISGSDGFRPVSLYIKY